MQQRLLSRDLTAEPEGMFDSLREPLPLGTELFPSSLSEELYRAATWDKSIDLDRFIDHRDTFAILELRHQQDCRLALPAKFFRTLSSYIDFETYLALRLSCRCWSAAITTARPVVWPAVSYLPAEVLESIYGYLSPIDFNSARHTCRAWMIASLDTRLLDSMLEQGSWSAGAQADMELRGLRSPRTFVNDEWLSSKRLATECSFQPGWTGNGLAVMPSDDDAPRKCLNLTSETDFTDLSNGYTSLDKENQVASPLFTVSVCNRYLLVSEGCVVYIYSIQNGPKASHAYGGHFAALTTIVCPHRVLAVSMDTSGGRFAVAALMEGRSGLVCDLREGLQTRTRSSSQASSTPTPAFKPFVYSAGPSAEDLDTGEASSRIFYEHEYLRFRGSYPSDRALARAIAESTMPEIHGANSLHRSSWTIGDPQTALSAISGAALNGPVAGFLPIESGPRSLYRNLCSVEDPPRSVAICPQRRCIAFGCSTGIELHWVDALTGHDLNRWFPLTAPSDFLYFLPPRPGVDSAKKLRLISSACHPKEREGLHGRFFPGNREVKRQGMSWDEGLADPTRWDNAWRGSGWCDHYRAVPVSDGWNVLFTDPESGALCLGSDAPPGAGSTKLVRRFMFVGPVEENRDIVVPRVYKSGGELRWGVRVVVAYGEAVWLFVVPPDEFGNRDQEQHSDDDFNAFEAHELREMEPKGINGIQIGNVPGLVDLAVDSTAGGLTIWAFAADGMAYVWEIASRRRPILKRVVLRDGTVRPEIDGEGDCYMRESFDPCGAFNQAALFDGSGSASIGEAKSRTRVVDKDNLSTISFKQKWNLDQGGDTVMLDAFLPHSSTANSYPEEEDPNENDDADSGYASGSDTDEDDEFIQAGGVFAINVPPLWGRWSDDENDDEWVPEYLRRWGGETEDEGLGVDLLGVGRVEVEILCG